MKRFLLYTAACLTTLALFGLAGAFGLYVWASKDLPSITKVSDYRPPQVTTVYSRDGNIMGYFFREKRFLINLDQMPPHLPKAFLAAEDARFFEHPGIDLKAIARAFISNLKAGGKPTSGASTITQQVVKRLLLTPERSYERKLKEAILAYQLEKYLSKEEILYIYLNQIYFGNSSYGVEAAARTYFGKHAGELSIAECAVLAGLPKAPSTNNPYSRPANTKVRQEWVLGRMLENNFITSEEYEAAMAQVLEYRAMPDPSWSIGSWYLEEVRRQLLAYFTEENVIALKIPIDMNLHGQSYLEGEGPDDASDDPAGAEGPARDKKQAIPFEERVVYEAGLHVYTAMDPYHQRSAEIALRAGLAEAGRRHGWNGPVTSLDAAGVEQFLAESAFRPEHLENAGWAKAVIVDMGTNGLDVRLSKDYSGHVASGLMEWTRRLNRHAGAAAKALAVGDVVWVSAVGASGVANPAGAPATDKRPAYKAEDVVAGKPIPLCIEQIPLVQGAVASIDVASGDLPAIAGGYSFSPESQFNRATQAKRQPGSSFKPIVYSAALDNGFTAGSMLLDSPFVLPSNTSRTWRPGNYDGKFLGPLILRTALTKSRNVCTVRVAQQVGMLPIVERAKQLGITGDIPPALAVSLGSWEATPLTMAEAYTAFADQGKRIKPCIIREVQDAWQQRLVSFEPEIEQVISEQNAYIMAYLLKEVVRGGTAARANILRRPVGGKTGTSNDERDAWFIGISPYLVTSVYVGYDDYTPMGRGETGGRAALPIFIAYRQMVDKLYEPTDFRAPSGIEFAAIDGHTGYLAGSGSAESYSLPFMSGTVPRVTIGVPASRGDDDAKAVDDWMKQSY